MTPDELADRAAITDVIYRYAYGIDHRLPDVVLSCFSDDAYIEYDGHLKLEGSDQLRAVLTRTADRRVGASAIDLDDVEATTHTMANVLITFTDAGAHAETTALACLAGTRSGAPVVLQRGLRYRDDLARIGGTWRITRRIHSTVWMVEAPATPRRARGHRPTHRPW